MKSSNKLTVTLILAALTLVWRSARAQDQPIATPAPAETSGSAEGATDHRNLEAMKAELDRLKEERAELATKFTEKGPRMMAVMVRIAQLENSIATYQKAGAEEMIKKMETELNDLNAQLGELKKTGGKAAEPNISGIEDRIETLESALAWNRAHDPAQASGLFEFKGGIPLELIRQASQYFHLDWREIATLPQRQQDIQVPAFRLYARQPTDILKLYNLLAESYPTLGKWKWQGEGASVDALVLGEPERSPLAGASETKVIAIPLDGIQNKSMDSLMNEIEAGKEEAKEFAFGHGDRGAMASLDGTISLHKETGILLAVGSNSFIDMVESVVNAKKLTSPTATGTGATTASPPPGSQ